MRVEKSSKLTGKYCTLGCRRRRGDFRVIVDKQTAFDFYNCLQLLLTHRPIIVDSPATPN